MNVLIITGAIVIIGSMAFINHVINKDESLLVKMWLVPLLSMLIVIPIALFGLFYWGILKIASNFNPIIFSDDLSLFGAVVLLIVAFLLAEVFIHPVGAVFYFLIFKRKPHWVEKNILSIFLDTLVIYLIMDLVPSVEMKHWMTAFSISVIVHVIGWLIEGIGKMIKKKILVRASNLASE